MEIYRVKENIKKMKNGIDTGKREVKFVQDKGKKDH